MKKSKAVDEVKERLDNMQRITTAAMRDARTAKAFADAALHMAQAAETLLTSGLMLTAQSVLSCMRILHTDYLRYLVSYEPGGVNAPTEQSGDAKDGG